MIPNRADEDTPRRSPLVWARDWAMIGGATAGAAPYGGDAAVPLDLAAFGGYTGPLGVATGALLGATLALLFSKIRGRSWVSFALAFGAVPVGAWGAAVAALPAFYLMDEVIGTLALACGAAAGLALGVWLLPVYVSFARRGLPVWPIVAVASAVAWGSGRVVVSVLIGLLFR